METIGFIVPVYKVCEEYLKQCVFSLINQTYKDIEIILVDDCSPDRCGELCDELKCKDNRIKVAHHLSNRGLPEARNTGISISTAKWLAFVDSDDWLDLNTAETLVSEINKQRADIYIFSGDREFDGKTLECAFTFDSERLFSTYAERNELEERYLLDQSRIRVPNSFSLQSACIRLVSRSLFSEGLKFIDVKYAEDALFHLYSTEYANSVKYIRQRFYHYRDTNGSMVNSFRPNAEKEQISVLREIWKFANTYNKDDRFKKNISLVAFLAMQNCVWQKYFHPSYNKSIRIRQKECKELFHTEYFKDVYNNISIKDLATNQKIKYVLFRLRLYSLANWLRSRQKILFGEKSQ